MHKFSKKIKNMAEVKKMKISKVKGFEIFDSRGNPTIAAEVTLENGVTGVASVPSGASTGEFEACEKRDGGTRLMGKGVRAAKDAVNGEINTLLCGKDVCCQRELDMLMIASDGTEDKSRFGANAILGVSPTKDSKVLAEEYAILTNSSLVGF